jgi:DNA-binding NarL/FixJ family response regulator
VRRLTALHRRPITKPHILAGKGDLACINPNHLSWKTHSDNEKDKFSHSTSARGERQWMAKLTEADVRAIRALAGTMSQREIAARFDLCQRSISGIVQRQTWGWLSD